MVDDFPPQSGPTIAANRRVDPTRDFVPLAEAHAMALRAFWRGAFLGSVGLAAFAGLILALTAVQT